MECQFRSKEFHYTLLFVLAVVLQSRVYLCWGAPVVTSPAGSTVAPSAMDIEGSNDTTTTCTTATVNTTVSSSEEQGDEFAGLQELRSGLKVLNIIAKNQLALELQLSDEGKPALDAANNSTGIRLALTVTCSLKKTAEAFERLPIVNGSAPHNANLTLLRVATDALFKSSCSWIRALYQAENRNSTTIFNCSCHEMNSICSNLDILQFTERLERQYHILQSSLLNETRSDRWIQENIEPDGNVLPEVYNIIN